MNVLKHILESVLIFVRNLKNNGIRLTHVYVFLCSHVKFIILILFFFVSALGIVNVVRMGN